MITSLTSKITKLRPYIEKYLWAFFVTYFILIFAPYVFAKVPSLNTFFTTGITRLIYRGLTCFIFGSFSMLLWIIYKPKIKYWSIIGAFTLFVIYLISVFLSPHSFSYVTLSLTSKVNFITFETGNFSYVSYSLSFLADLIVFLLFLNFVPCAMRKVSDLYPTFFFLISFMLIACLYTLVFEREGIISLLNGASEYDVFVSSFFHSKNSFGLFLFVASFCCSFIFFTCKKAYLKFVIIPHCLFSVVSILVLCKSAFISNLILLLGCLFYYLFVTLSGKPKTSIILLVLFSILLISFVVFMVIPQLHVGIFEKPYKVVLSVFEKIFGGLSSRFGRWIMVGYVVTGPFILFGANDSFSSYALDIMSRIEQNLSFTDFHSGYVSWYASHGIIGSILYFSFFIFLFILIFKLIKKDKKNGLLLLMLYMSCLIFIIPETYTLFISISSYAFIINLVLIGYLYFLINKYYPDGIWKKEKENIQVNL